jgi:hypothetical protein
MQSNVGVRDVDPGRLDNRKTAVGSPSHGTHSPISVNHDILSETRTWNGVPFGTFLTLLPTYHSTLHFSLTRRVRTMLMP